MEQWNTVVYIKEYLSSQYNVFYDRRILPDVESEIPYCLLMFSGIAS